MIEIDNPDISRDKFWMRRALRLAKNGIGFTSPNPPVGAVLVRNGELIGEGWHQKVGEAHAEILALQAADWPARPLTDAANCTLYITLEPCSTSGRTPACTDAILKAGIGRVVWAADDPNPTHHKRASTILSNITTTTHVCRKPAEELLRAWTTFITKKRPWVTAKAGMTLDGRITRSKADSPWITSTTARKHAMTYYRGQADAILVGAETIRADNPQLTYRGKLDKSPLWRIVVSRSGNLPLSAKVFTDESRHRTLVYHDVHWPDLLTELAELGIVRLLIEGGGHVSGALFAAGLVDEVAYYISPELGLSGLSVATADHAPIRLHELRVDHIGPDLLVTALVKP